MNFVLLKLTRSKPPRPTSHILVKIEKIMSDGKWLNGKYLSILECDLKLLYYKKENKSHSQCDTCHNYLDKVFLCDCCI